MKKNKSPEEIIKLKDKNREKRLKKLFSLSLEDYQKIFILQNGCCAICKKPPKEGKSLAVDHNHKNGLIRRIALFCL